MIHSNEFDLLKNFISFAELASQSDGLTSNAFENKAGSFLSTLLSEPDRDAYTVLRSINALSRTLDSLARLVEEGLSSARSQLLPRIYNEGLHSLPFEIVAHIFELSEDKKNPYYSSTNLLLVNSYFRDLAVRMPNLWTTVDVDQDPSLSLQRTGSSGLIVNFSSIDDSSRSGRFLRLLEPHIGRWQSFYLEAGEAEEIDDPDSDEGIVLMQLHEELKGKNFSGLEHLEVSFDSDSNSGLNDHDEPFPHAIQDQTSATRSFFSEWNVPTLRSISVNGFIPTIPLTCRTSLTSLRLGLNGDNNIGGWDLTIISETLSSLSSLEDLSLQLKLISSWRNGEEAWIELPGLRSLTLSLHYCEPDPSRRLIDALSIPHITKLTLFLLDYSQENVTEIIEALFPRSVPRWLSLETLVCLLYPGDAMPRSRATSSDFYPLNLICSRLPPLHHLYIRAINICQPPRLELHQFFRNPTDDPENPPAPPLRTLRIEMCNFFDSEFIIGLENVIRAPEFVRLEIAYCLNLNVERVRNFMPVDKQFQYIESVPGVPGYRSGD